MSLRRPIWVRIPLWALKESIGKTPTLPQTHNLNLKTFIFHSLVALFTLGAGRLRGSPLSNFAENNKFISGKDGLRTWQIYIFLFWFWLSKTNLFIHFQHVSERGEGKGERRGKVWGGGSGTWGTWDHRGIWGRNWEAREEGTTMITTTILHPHPHAPRNKTRREEIELTLYTQGHKSNSAYAMDLFLGFQL